MNSRHIARPGRLRLPGLLAMAGVLLVARPAAADLIVSVSSVPLALPGSTGNLLEVDLTDTGSSAVDVGSFTFGIGTNDPRITFTSADTSTTSPYIFDGHSFVQDFGVSLNTSSGPSLVGSDLSDSLASTTVGAGDTVGLGRVFFDVSNGPGPAAVVPVVLDPNNTSLADDLGNPVPIDTLSNGSITLLGTSVPEPSSLVLFGLGLLGCAALCPLRRRRGRPARAAG